MTFKQTDIKVEYKIIRPKIKINKNFNFKSNAIKLP